VIDPIAFKDEINHSISASFNNIGLIYYKVRNYINAIKYYEKSLEIIKSVFKDEDHPIIDKTRKFIALIKKKLERSDSEMKYCTRSCRSVKNRNNRFCSIQLHKKNNTTPCRATPCKFAPCRINRIRRYSFQ